MGLSRNKVAVSEGAAGSPPFYGESESNQQRLRMDSYSDIVLTERVRHRIKGRWRNYERRTRELESECKISCCSIVSDLRPKGHGSLKQWKQSLYGGVAQLGEHLPCKQGVKGSIPFISTSR